MTLHIFRRRWILSLAKKSAATPLTICFVGECKSEPVPAQSQGHGQSLSSSSVLIFFGSARFLFCAAFHLWEEVGGNGMVVPVLLLPQRRSWPRFVRLIIGGSCDLWAAAEPLTVSANVALAVHHHQTWRYAALDGQSKIV